ncbi:GDSL esterase/lipase-like protein [Tanacetum coccineum]
MSLERDTCRLSRPLHLTSVDLTDVDHRRSVAACMVQSIYIMQRDRQKAATDQKLLLLLGGTFSNLRGTLTKGDAFTLDLHFVRKILHQSSRFEIAIQVVRNLIASGNSNIWLVGHSLGSTMATLAGYYVHRVKMGNIGVKGVERVAAQHFIAGLFMDAIGKVLHEPIHLFPLANLTLNLKNAGDLKEAHGLHQWWRLDE